MNILKKIDNYLNENKLRGFSSQAALGDEIEIMDSTIERKDRKKFDKILGSYLDKVCNDNVSIRDCVLRLSKKESINLYDDLLDLHYVTISSK